MRVPRPPIVSASTLASTPVSSEARKIIQHDSCDSDFDFEPQSDDPNYLCRFEVFNRDWATWEINNSKAQGQKIKSIDTALQPEYRSIKEPKALLDKIKADIREIIKLDGKFEREKLATSKLESYSNVSE
ncbi:hypothetical protein K440DRAFT_642025 [Wilcoxina mikolae CBS 423.85]|nr:hypothetical protein K440DRAFT_642025 [Wilcoxina mikolae CBS 423.85]